MKRLVVSIALTACTEASAPPPAPPPSGQHLPGYVTITQNIGPDTTGLGARFEDGRDQCATTAIDGCTYTHCPIDSLASSYDAGLITIAGTSEQTLSPKQESESQIGYGAQLTGHVFADNETLAISTTGNTVPAFSTTLAMPALATVAMPASLVVDRTQPFSFAWTGGAGDLVIFWTFGGTQSIDCRFPASTGSATVPADVMAMLPVGGGYLDYATQTEVDLDVAPWDVQVFASEGAAWADGSAADASVTFQ